MSTATTDLSDAHPEAQTCDPVFGDYGGRTAFFGPIKTLKVFEDNALVEPMDALYLASASQLMDAVRKTPETVRSLLLIGHNPGLHELAVALAGEAAAARGGKGTAAGRLAEAYPTGALAEFTVGVPWRAVAPGSGRLVRFLSPRDLLG